MGLTQKREKWNDGHYHVVVRDESNRIVFAPRWHKGLAVDVANERIESYNDKHPYSNPLSAVTNYIIHRDKEHSNFSHHYKIFVPTDNGGYWATVKARRELSYQEIADKAQQFIGSYGDNADYDMVEISGLEIYG
jgi:hypothetical protein